MAKFRKWDWVKIDMKGRIMLGLVVNTRHKGAEIALWYCDTRVGAEMRTSTVDLIWLATKTELGSVERIPKAIALLLKPNEWRGYDGKTN